LKPYQTKKWLDTKVIFDIFEKENSTYLQFTHEGLNTQLECFNACSNAWSVLIQQSLAHYINTGQSIKVFK
jgi:hypothetical protein